MFRKLRKKNINLIIESIQLCTYYISLYFLIVCSVKMIIIIEVMWINNTKKLRIYF